MLPLLLLAGCYSPEAEIHDGEFVRNDAAPQLAESDSMQEPEMSTSSAADAIQVKAQKNALLANSYVGLGNDAFERGDYEGSAIQYAEANRLDATNIAARDGLRRAQTAMAGNTYDIDSAENVIQNEALRQSANRMRVEGLVRDGDRAMGQAAFSTAVDKYTMAVQALNYSPNMAYGFLDTNMVQGKLDEATSARNSSEASARNAQAMAADAEAREALQARADYSANRIASFMGRANEQFMSGFPDRAVTTLDQLLRIDPRNPEATELRSIAVEAALRNRQDQTADDFREGWQRTFEEMRTLTVPPNGSIEFDLDHWAKIADRAPLDMVETTTEMDAVEASIRYSLANTRIIPNFDDALEEIVPNLQAFAKVNFVITREVRDDIDEDVKTIRMSFKNDMPVDRILSIMEDLMGGEVKFIVKNGSVYVVTAEQADADSITRQYDVRDIIRPIKDFPLPEYNLIPSGGIEADEEELPESEATILTEDDLIATITESIDPDSWDGETHSVNIENGTLIVHHSPEVQAEIANMLVDLRVPANIMVDIKVRFLRVEDSFLEDIGVDFRGLGNDSTAGSAGKGDELVFDDFGSDAGSPGNPGTLGTGTDAGFNFREASDDLNILARSENLYDTSLGDDAILTNSGGLALQYTWLDDAQLEMILRAVKKSKRSELVIEPSLMVYNTARANLVVANQVSYVSDFDVEIASSASIADPIVQVANDGVYLDVRPVVTADRRFVWIDVRPTVANLLRPIPTLQTSLGVGSPVTLMLPQLELQKVRTRVILPDGGTLMLGGMKILEEQEMDSGIPYLNQIPVLSFFFSRKGTYETYQKLVILLTANIILMDELEPGQTPTGY
ncbi:MAG: hypothetical protein QM477_02100 [Planctomycetota bacterium]